MRALLRFFRSLRGKLILTYALVTVLALLALEALALALLYIPASLLNIDREAYFSDVVYVLYPQASAYLQPGAEDLPGLQAWLEAVYSSGYASLPPQDIMDSPAAPIVKTDPMVVLSPDAIVLAQAPLDGNSLVGRRYVPPETAGVQEVLDNALNGDFLIEGLYAAMPDGNYLMAFPVTASDRFSELVGAMVVTVEPPPINLITRLRQTYQNLFLLVGVIALTGIGLLVAVAPIAALFGFIMSRGLTRRLHALTLAADAWSEGNFTLQPQDRSRDEIGILGQQMRRMAERVQTLLQSQHELARLEERNRLARDLHDTVKQQTFATLMQVRAARNLLAQDPEAAGRHLTEAEALLKTSQQELGLMIAELHPAALEGQGLAAALGETLSLCSVQTCIPVDYKVQNERRLPLAVEQALYRVAQEALSNAARHSQASSLAVSLEFEKDRVTLTVCDNGVGFHPEKAAPQGFGLVSMRERMEALGGSLHIVSTEGNGTIITATAGGKDG